MFYSDTGVKGSARNSGMFQGFGKVFAENTTKQYIVCCAEGKTK